MGLGVSHSRAVGQTLSTEAPRPADAATLPEAPAAADYPDAKVVSPAGSTMEPELRYDTLTRHGTHYTLDGHVQIRYAGRLVEADHIEYDKDTGELDATGHLRLTGGPNDESIAASHGTLNTRTQTGRLYDVTGSVGLKRTPGRQAVYTNGNPFLFTGREVVKTGPQSYDIYDGTVTSCQLPHPDWLFSAGHFSVVGGKARAKGSTFRLLNVPVFYFPFVTHPTDSEERQAGVLIPVLGQSSTKGFVIGETIYLPFNRSSDLMVGAEYFSRRGFSQLATFRYRGLGDDFAQVHYTGLLDRQNGPLGTSLANQGGEDLAAAGRHDFRPETRVAAQVEYLSSYVYREAFSENFNQAVSTDITSVAYGVHQANGWETALEADRYQGLKRVPVDATATTAAQPGEEIRLFHVPSLSVASTDHRIAGSPFLWSFDSSAAGLKRVQPNFATGGVVERLDLHPTLSLPLGAAGWRMFASAGARETLYSRSRTPGLNGEIPLELTQGLSRSSVDVELSGRAPVLERDFDSPTLQRIFGGTVRHTVEPAITYRYVTGINNFNNILRFDDRDIASNTNELEYGATQRLFVRTAEPQTCDARGSAVPLGSPGFNSPEPVEASTAGTANCHTHPLLSWTLAQKYFFDPTFGGAVISGRRNIFDTTLNLSGVAFLTEPRNISPLVSRLRARASEHVDVEWDADLDTGARRFTSNVLLADVHQGSVFGGVSYARLNAPGRSYVEGVASLVADFDQLRFLVGVGSPARRGFSVAASSGLDLNNTQVQYATVQTAYNWNCCGLSVEYRKYELGSVRNENAYRFNFTLANIGSAGNLRHADRLF